MLVDYFNAFIKMKLIKKIIAPLINKAKQSTFVRNMFEAPFNMKAFPAFATFIDSKGYSHSLLQGLRSKIKPGWQNMFIAKTPSVKGVDVKQIVKNGTYAAQKITPLISNFGKNISQCTILEIGCNTGATSFALANKGAKKVVGSEFAGYKVASIDQNNVTDSKLETVSKELQEIREQLSQTCKNKSAVTFVEDDICNSQLPRNHFDIICSWDVLEHLHDTQKAFQSMAELLSQDGLLIHEYNPFFSLNGGHSLCTLDFLWGHTRLSQNDFVRYLDEVRPTEKEMALSFYTEGLNRMTLADCKAQLQQAGLEIISILPYAREPHVRMVTTDILTQTQAIYPKVDFMDLVATRVVVIARKR